MLIPDDEVGHHVETDVLLHGIRDRSGPIEIATGRIEQYTRVEMFQQRDKIVNEVRRARNRGSGS